MARVTIEDCLEKVASRFSLVHLASRRVLQLRSGGVPTLEVPKNKEVVIALREIAAGTVTMENIRELEELRALPEAGSREREIMARMELKEVLEEATTQFEGTYQLEGTEQIVDQDQMQQEEE